MPHDVSLITTLAVGFGLALLFGFIADRMKLPALVGYLVAGIAIGPATPGFVADLSIASQLSEIGVMLLMFGVGLHFSLDDLLSVRKIALPGALVQMAVATGLGMLLGHSWGWSWGGALVFGLALSVASTVVLLKALEAQGVLDSGNGRIAVGWLVVEDLAMVLVLVLLPPLAGVLGGDPAAAGATASATAGDGALVEAAHQGTAEAANLWQTLGLTLLQVGAFVALMLVVGRRVFPWLLWQVARTGSRELFTLCVVAAAVGIAYGSSALFGVSFALGAFFAGMVMRESSFSHRAAEESLPLRDAFAVLFFVSVGMLFEPKVLVEAPWRVLGVVAVIMVGKTLAAGALVLLLRYPLGTAVTVSASLAQIGEFSFILVALGGSLGLLPPQGQSLVLAGALISIALNPLLFRAAEPLQRWAVERSPLARRLSQRDDPLAELPPTTEPRLLSKQVVLVGHGRVGRRIADALDGAKLPYVVVDQQREQVEQLRARGIAAVGGDAADEGALIQAHIARARLLVIATPDTLAAQKMIATARMLNPEVAVVLRTHSGEEADRLRDEAYADVFYAEDELGRSMAQRVLERMLEDPKAAAAGAASGTHRPQPRSA